MALVDRLDRWVDVHDHFGSPLRSALRPGLTESQLRYGEARLGFELLPDICEFLMWATCGPGLIYFVPSGGYVEGWLTPALILRRSEGAIEVGNACDEDEEWCRPSPRPVKMVALFDGYTAFDHGDGPTRGGMWIWDGGGGGWMAPSFSHLIDTCLEFAERDWLRGGAYGLHLNDKAKAASRTKEAEFYAQHPDHAERIDLEWHLESLRLDAYDNPQLVTTRRRDWIWDRP